MYMKKARRNASAVIVAIACFIVLAATWTGRLQAQKQSQQPRVDANGAPMFRVDAFWPKRLPNRWSMQQVTGLYVEEKNDHVWFLNRGAAADGDEIGGDGDPPRIACCVRGRGVSELGLDGSVVNAWGGVAC